MNRTRAIVIVAFALVALLVAVVFTGRDLRESDPAPAAMLAPQPAAGSALETASAGSAASTGTVPLGSGETLAVSRESLVSGRPLVVRLQLAQPEDSGEPLSGRIVTEGRVLDLSAAVGGEASDVAEVEIDADWLTPGRYVIEIHTSERSHFPLRRYALEVR